MLVPGNIGFSCLLLLLLSLPVVGFFLVRRKWRLAVARGEEVRRLLVLAEEEVARAELESSSACFGAFPGALSFNPQPQCAVCFCPTTTRCARCKAVRYCSGRCQIIHWRQGHKQKCHPPSIDYQNNRKGSNSCLKVVKQKCDDSHKAEGKDVAKPYEAPAREPASANSARSYEPLHRGDGNMKVKPLANVLETNLISKSSRASVSDGFVSSASSTETFYDASDIEIDGRQSVAVSGDFLDNPSSISKKHQIQRVILEDTKLAGSVDSCTSSTVSSVEDTQSVPTSCSDPDIDSSVDGSFVEFSTASSGLRKETLDSNKYPDTDNRKSSLDVAGSENVSSEAGAFKRFSFNLSGYAIPPLLDNSECKLDAALEIKESISGVVLSENSSKGVAVVKNLQSLSSERYKHTELHAVRDSGPTSSSRLSSKGPKDVHSSNIPHLSKSRKAGTGTSNAQPTSDSGRNSLSGDKLGKGDDNHASAANLLYPQNVSNGLKTSVRKVVDQIRPSKLLKQYPVGGGSEISKRSGDKGLFPYEVFVKLYNWKKEELQPCGLTNCGNSCFANVVLQCLAFTPPLTAYLLQGLHSKACRKPEWCFTCEFESLILKSKEGKSPLSPIGILSQIGRISSHLCNGKEEDAHEFLRYVIDTMQSVCLKEAGANESRDFGEETTFIGLTFGGYLRSKIKCMKCRGKSEQHERMMDLTVEIEGDIGSLEDALRKFTSTEILDGENKYKCSRCKSFEKAKKKLTVLEAPNVLTIALKRFQSGKFGKLNKLIRFPDTLDLAPYMSGASDKTHIYSLYGVVVHLDIMNAAFSGHYVCYVKNIQNKWFKIDDSTVKAVDLEMVLTKGAYMLFYSRGSPRAPKSIRNTVISHDVTVKTPQGMKKSSPKSTLYPGCMSSDGVFSADWVHRSFDVDFCSDNSSLISGSDEGSYSTESSRDSTSTGDLSDYIFGDLGYGWSSPHWGSSDSDTSSSSVLRLRRHSSLADLER